MTSRSWSGNHFGGRCALTLVMLGLSATSLSAATLADWRLAEANGGYVDPAAGVLNSFTAAPGAPFQPSVDSSGHSSRDLARMRGDMGSYNFRNQTTYVDLATASNFRGFNGPVTYFHNDNGTTFYPTADSRGVYAGNDGSDSLQTVGANPFSNADFSGGFTLEAIFRPGVGLYQLVTTDGGGVASFRDNGTGFIFSDEGVLNLAITDADPSAGVSPVISFGTYNQPSGLSTSVQTPLDIQFLADNSSRYLSFVGIYDPTGSGSLKMYIDGVLVADSSSAVAPTPDSYDTAAYNLATVGALPSPSLPYTAISLIDEVRLSSGVVDRTEFLIPLPEPGAAGILAIACVASLKRRRAR